MASPLLIHFPIQRNLGCFPSGAIRNNAAMNMYDKFLCEYLFSILLYRYLGVEVLGLQLSF